MKAYGGADDYWSTLFTMSPSNRKPKRHSTKEGASSFWDSKRISLCALFVAAALLLSFIEIPILPAAPFLKYDLSGVVALIAGLAFGQATGAVVAVLPWCAHLFVEPIGAIIALLTNVVTVLVAASIYALRRTRAGAVVALIVASIVQIGLAILLNLCLTPLYTGLTFEVVLGLVVPILLPFNLIKATLNALITLVLYKPLSKAIGT